MAGGTCPPPKASSNFYKHNSLLHRRVGLLFSSSSSFCKFNGHYTNVPFKKLALLGPAAIVDHFTDSGARRLRFVFMTKMAENTKR